MYLIDPSEPAKFRKWKTQQEAKGESNQIRIPKTAEVLAGEMELPRRPLEVASILVFFIIECEDFCERCEILCSKRQKVQKASKPAKSTVFRILTETNINSKTTKSTRDGIGLHQIHPLFTPHNTFGFSILFNLLKRVTQSQGSS